jgi:hypothetical protein
LSLTFRSGTLKEEQAMRRITLAMMMATVLALNSFGCEQKDPSACNCCSKCKYKHGKGEIDGRGEIGNLPQDEAAKAQ